MTREGSRCEKQSERAGWTMEGYCRGGKHTAMRVRLEGQTGRKQDADSRHVGTEQEEVQVMIMKGSSKPHQR